MHPLRSKAIVVPGEHGSQPVRAPLEYLPAAHSSHGPPPSALTNPDGHRIHMFVLPSSRKLPTGHGMQSLAIPFGANPLGQAAHDALSGAATFPLLQETHPVRSLLGSWPAPHAVHPDFALLAYLFAGHSMHTPELNVLVSVFEKKSAGHPLQCASIALSSRYSPARHAAHAVFRSFARSSAAHAVHAVDPLLLAYFPTPQGSHSAL